MKKPLTIFVLLLTMVSANLVLAEHTPTPSSVTITGSLQDELGCPGDWQPDCAFTHLAYDAADDVWQGVFSIPAGNWEYKAALNGSWDENYGANAQQNGPNIPLNLGAAEDVKFYYDHKSHWVTDNENSVIATVPGSFQNWLGCPGDWQPDCLRAWLQDPDSDGLYTFATDAIPPGGYEAKVTIDESWDENYGAGGVQNGPNIPFTVGANETVTFEYDPVTHILTITACIGDLTARAKSGKVQLVWTDTGADAYNVYRSTTSGGPYAFLANTISTYSTYLDMDVVNGTTYYYMVREERNGVEVCTSNEASATPTSRTRRR